MKTLLAGLAIATLSTHAMEVDQPSLSDSSSSNIEQSIIAKYENLYKTYGDITREETEKGVKYSSQKQNLFVIFDKKNKAYYKTKNQTTPLNSAKASAYFHKLEALYMYCKLHEQN